MKQVWKKEFIIAALNPEEKIYIIYVINFFSLYLYVYFSLQIIVRALLSTHIFTRVYKKYTDFQDIFLSTLATKFIK